MLYFASAIAIEYWRDRASNIDTVAVSTEPVTLAGVTFPGGTSALGMLVASASARAERDCGD
ncbi:hypothetical protein [Chitinolyticbacter albus]|uniref:hypothetical protein n=1 Tax=Chitinolyticbacter albus TaxID=2961951 RepID=UPI00210DD972|nr:hypothetical protein [Chitinolyticbacter albus]